MVHCVPDRHEASACKLIGWLEPKQNEVVRLSRLAFEERGKQPLSKEFEPAKKKINVSLSHLVVNNLSLDYYYFNSCRN